MREYSHGLCEVYYFFFEITIIIISIVLMEKVKLREGK